MIKIHVGIFNVLVISKQFIKFFRTNLAVARVEKDITYIWRGKIPPVRYVSILFFGGEKRKKRKKKVRDGDRNQLAKLEMLSVKMRTATTAKTRHKIVSTIENQTESI